MLKELLPRKAEQQYRPMKRNGIAIQGVGKVAISRPFDHPPSGFIFPGKQRSNTPPGKTLVTMKKRFPN
ncbi:hypothetical protein ZHAS_00011086 [Anopheles sinensis]|uniref:Uncharacterized protein n=1 Tax=Anopheles sinensis TaxID=74873 RepID=A0A084VZA6_ANOSI|nr:hypothetical protein ZHAS_00011086 [Anopheles sinensis]